MTRAVPTCAWPLSRIADRFPQSETTTGGEGTRFPLGGFRAHGNVCLWHVTAVCALHNNVSPPARGRRSIRVTFKICSVRCQMMPSPPEWDTGTLLSHRGLTSLIYGSELLGIWPMRREFPLDAPPRVLHWHPKMGAARILYQAGGNRS